MIGIMKKKKDKKTREEIKENSSPVCFANSDELRDEYKEEVGAKSTIEGSEVKGKDNFKGEKLQIKSKDVTPGPKKERNKNG